MTETKKPIVLFQAFQSAPDISFWGVLGKLKLESFQLNDEEQVRTSKMGWWYIAADRLQFLMYMSFFPEYYGRKLPDILSKFSIKIFLAVLALIIRHFKLNNHNRQRQSKNGVTQVCFGIPIPWKHLNYSIKRNYLIQQVLRFFPL